MSVLPPPPPSSTSPPPPPPPPFARATQGANYSGQAISAPRAPLSRKAKLAWAGVVVAVVLSLAGYWVYQQMDRTPGKAAIRHEVELYLKAPGQRVVDVSTETLKESKENQAYLKFTATVELTEPLFTQVASADYLTQQGADPLVFKRIGDILGGQGSPRLRELAGLKDSVANLNDVALLRESSPTGHRHTVAGKIVATRADNLWKIGFMQGFAADSQPPVGRKLSEYRGDVLVLDRPQDAEKARSIVANAGDVLKRLEPARAQWVKEEAEKTEQKRQERLAAQQEWLNRNLAKIQPGTLFVGTATDRNGSPPQILYLEITDLDKERNRVSAWLRNDGGWADTRRIQGTYVADIERDVFTVKLDTRVEQAVRNAGPFLQWEEVFTAPLTLDNDTLKGTTGNWSWQLTRVKSEEQKNKEIANARENELKWMEASKVGAVYKVLATRSDRGWSEEYYFTFTKNEKNGIQIEGKLELPARQWSRQFTGTLITNKYMAQGKPLKLFTKTSDRIAQAHELSPLQYEGDFSWAPQLDSGRMRLDDRWHLEFEPVSAEDMKKVLTFVSSVPAVDSVASKLTATAATLIQPVTDANGVVSPLALPQQIQPRVPAREGAYLYDGRTWIGISQAALDADVHAVSKREMANQIRRNPQGPWHMASLGVTCARVLSVDSGSPLVLGVRGRLANLPPMLVTKYAKATLIKAALDGDNHWSFQIYSFPDDRPTTIGDQAVGCAFEEAENGLLIIKPAGPVAPGHYVVMTVANNWIFEVKK